MLGSIFIFLFSQSKTILFLHRQIETEAGSAGEQPVRDIFDQSMETSKRRIVN